MALSTRTMNTLIDALASKTTATAFVAAVGARSTAALTTNQISRIVDMCGSQKAGNELLASMVSGATMSASTSKRVIIGMAGDGAGLAGNELLNFVQTTPNAKPYRL